MTAKNTTLKISAAGSFVDDLNTAVKNNPLAAGLIGLGALWMFFGGSRALSLGASLGSASQKAAGTVASGSRTAVDAIGEGLTAAKARVEDAVGVIGTTMGAGVQKVSNVARDVTETASNAFSAPGNGANPTEHPKSEMTDAFFSTVTSMQKNLQTGLERQPLLLGAIGMAVGMGIASTFSSTKVESELGGETGKKVKDKLVEFAADTADSIRTRAEQTLGEVTKEASAQGLTPSAANKQFTRAAEKIKTVAAATRDVVKDRLS